MKIPIGGWWLVARSRQPGDLLVSHEHIQGFEAMLWLRKGFGFTGPWIVREQNHLLTLCFGLPQVNKA